MFRVNDLTEENTLLDMHYNRKKKKKKKDFWLLHSYLQTCYPYIFNLDMPWYKV